MERDPRIDPKPGDVLLVDGRHRTVVYVGPDANLDEIVEFESVPLPSDPLGRSLKIIRYIDQWKRSTKNAEVIHAADPNNDAARGEKQQ